MKDLTQLFPGDWVAGLDAPATDPIEVLTPDLSTVSAFADIVLRVGSILLHIDFQTSPDPRLARRMMVYNALLYERYGIPVHTIVVLLRPRADRGDLTHRASYQARPGRGSMDFNFEIVRVWQLPVEGFLNGPLGMLPLAVLGELQAGQQPNEAIPWSVSRIVERVNQEVPAEERAKILTSVLNLTGLRLPKRRSEQIFQEALGMQEELTA